ncbi:hypothetical protein Tco_0064724 [Tanacetum coccineum]
MMKSILVHSASLGGGSPGTKNYGCGYFDWKDAFDERLMVSSSSTSEGSSGPYRSEQPQPSYSPGPYRSAQPQSSYSSGPHRSARIKKQGIEGKTKDVGGKTGNEKESDYHASQSSAILNDLLDDNDMEDLHM